MAMTLQAWTRRLNRGTMEVMRVDNSDPGKHDHGFGLGAHEPELNDVSLGDEQLGQDNAGHGLLDSLGHGALEQLGGHVEIAQDFGHDQHHDGLDGLHDSVHASLGLGFGADDHHSLHEGLHEGLHDAQHDVGHDTQPDVAHDTAHDHDLSDLF